MRLSPRGMVIGWRGWRLVRLCNMDRLINASVLRLLAVLLLALSLSGISAAAEEVAENVVHVADTGHGAHASEHPEGEPCSDTEHFCVGGLHNCNCCPSAIAALANGASLPWSSMHEVAGESPRADVMGDALSDRIERPPRA